MRMQRRAMLIAAPLMLCFLFLYVFTFLYSLKYTVTESAFSAEFVGLKNYQQVFENKYFRLGMKNTFEIMAVSVPILVAFSLFLALEVSALGGNYRLLRGAFLLPMLIPSASVMPVFTNLFVSQHSFFYRLFSEWGFSRGQLARLPVYLLFLWKNCGFNMILFLSALRVIPGELYEAASLDGAGRVRLFTRITLPAIVPTLFFVTVYSMVQSLRIFKEVYLLYGAYPDPSVYLVQNYMNNHFYKLNYQYLTTGAVIFAVIVYVVVAVMYHFEGKRGLSS